MTSVDRLSSQVRSIKSRRRCRPFATFDQSLSTEAVDEVNAQTRPDVSTAGGGREAMLAYQGRDGRAYLSNLPVFQSKSNR